MMPSFWAENAKEGGAIIRVDNVAAERPKAAGSGSGVPAALGDLDSPISLRL